MISNISLIAINTVLKSYGLHYSHIPALLAFSPVEINTMTDTRAGVHTIK